MSEDSKPTVKRPFYKRDPVTSIVLVMLIFLLSQIAAIALVSVYPALRNWTGDQATEWLEGSVYAQFAFILIAEITALWAIARLLKRAHVTWKRIGLLKPVVKDVAHAVVGYGIYFVSFLIIIIIASNLSSLIDVDQPQQIGFEAARGAELILVYLSLAIFPPIVEEIMFRGFLFTSLRGKYRFRYTAVITSVIFGLFHLQYGSGAPLLWAAAIDTFVLSMVLCYLRERTGSLAAPILLHTIKNSVAFVFLFYGRF